MKPTPDDIEEKRLLKILANKNASDFELEDAQQRLAALTERRNPTCPHCEKATSTHGGSACPVVVKFRRPFGKLGASLIPTASQAAELRAKLAEDEAAESRADTKRAAKAGQGNLF